MEFITAYVDDVIYQEAVSIGHPANGDTRHLIDHRNTLQLEQVSFGDGDDDRTLAFSKEKFIITQAPSDMDLSTYASSSLKQRFRYVLALILFLL